MKQFEQLKWVRQGFLAIIMVSIAAQSHALSVRERYLLNHPEAKAEAKAEPSAQSIKSGHHKNHSAKHAVVEKAAPVAKTAKHHKSTAKVVKEVAPKHHVTAKHHAVTHKLVAKAETVKPKHHVKTQAAQPKVVHHRKHHKE
ncbi:hypothetical protein [Aquirhabdus sp.]|uniref:hypothetical protein n=1 Tax=Aquirhabdus sp. TaxID=2824160 RepID=UPI00396CCD22